MGRELRELGITQISERGSGEERENKMGSSGFKGNNGHSHSHRGKPYALMLLLAFGAAILGVMVLHKLREKRIFNVVVKEKDHELLTLHLMFQREKEFNKESRRKIEEMKNKVYTLRSQKLELERKVSELESTVQALKDERKVIESALEEKKNEIKMLTEEGRTMNSSSHRIASLMETIKTQEAEIEELKILLERAVDAHSANTNASIEFENFGAQDERDNDTVSISNSTKDASVTERENKPEKLNDEEGGAAGAETDATSDKQEDRKTQKVEKGGGLITDEKLENKTTASQSNQAANETNTGREGEQRRRKDDESNQSMADNPRDQESYHRGGVKLEKSDGSDFERGLGSRYRKRHSKGKRWREIVRNRRLGHSLYSVTNGAEAALVKHSSNEVTGTDQLAQSDKPNHAREAGGDDPARKEQKKRDEGEQEEQNNKGNVEEKSDEIISNQTERQQESGKLEKMERMDGKTQENDNEQKREVETEEAEAEEVEDAETHEPEIDKADIQRFSESDHDEETEEPEF